MFFFVNLYIVTKNYVYLCYNYNSIYRHNSLTIKRL